MKKNAVGLKIIQRSQDHPKDRETKTKWKQVGKRIRDFGSERSEERKDCAGGRVEGDVEWGGGHKAINGLAGTQYNLRSASKVCREHCWLEMAVQRKDLG